MTQPIQVDLGLISRKKIFDCLVILISSQSYIVPKESNLGSFSFRFRTIPTTNVKQFMAELNHSTGCTFNMKSHREKCRNFSLL
jgi:hypothetical protein